MCNNQRGTVLPVTLMIMLLLTTLAMAVTAVGMSEPQIASNLAGSAQARAVAEAGLEWGYVQVANAASFSAALATADANGVVHLTAAPAPIPGLTNAAGTFIVTLRNDDKNGDNIITGVPKEASATVDTNNRLILTATGTFGNATRTIRVMIKRAVLPPQVGAIALPGNDSNTMFTGTQFEVNGNDHNVANLGQTPTAGSCAATYGIAVATSSNETTVQNSLSATQKPKVLGKKQVSSGATSGDNTIAPDTTLTKQGVVQFVRDVSRNADIVLNTTASTGLSYNNIGGTSNCTTWSSSSCWGTATNPKIVYIKGVPDSTSAFTALALSGSVEGHGILIVEDGDLVISGNFLWHGLVIVTGQWVGLGFMGSAATTDQNVYGGVIINETATDPAYEGVVAADAKLRYSCQGLSQGQGSRKLLTMSSWLEVGQ